MLNFKKSKWIWIEEESKPDTYGEFYSEFYWEEGDVNCLLSCDGDYTLFINGRYVSSNQYGDYEWYKSVDKLIITPFLKKGKNAIAILVWHFGTDSQRYLKAKAGLIFEVKTKDEILLASDENTLARHSKAYAQGLQKLVTRQLGFSFCYDSTKEDEWTTTGKGFSKATLVKKDCNFISRPNNKLQLIEPLTGNVILSENNHYVIDLGKEVIGLPILDFVSPTKQLITVAWGEDLQDGHVRKNLEHRDFSFDYVAKVGDNKYVNYMLRMGCRYLEIFTENPIDIAQISVIPQIYAVKEKQVKLDNELNQKIYDACVNSLKLCMMEHYVDTPWREQCLYVYDSRNQALCGYYAFENGNAEYVRSNLKLISQDRRQDGLLSICYPCGMDLTIPSFSLYYFIQVNEYLKHTEDTSLALEIYDKLLSVLNVFLYNMKGGLVLRFEGDNHWNFYDWTDHLSGLGVNQSKSIPDAMINILFVIALQNFKEIAESIGKTFDFDQLLNESIIKIKEEFFRTDKGLFELTKGGGEFTVLVNSLAVIAGITTKDESAFICESIKNGELLDCTLSMKIFKYQALLTTDKAKWQKWVIAEIRREYGKMIENGNTVWETIDGAVAFDNAGSLCHGWSAIPLLLLVKNEVFS